MDIMTHDLAHNMAFVPALWQIAITLQKAKFPSQLVSSPHDSDGYIYRDGDIILCPKNTCFSEKRKIEGSIG